MDRESRKPAIEAWPRRLSEAIREALVGGDFALALRLASCGDGQARNLEKEYALMLKGLVQTTDLLAMQVAQSVTENSPGESESFRGALSLLHGFALQLRALPAWSAPEARPETSPTAAQRRIHALLGELERWFDATHSACAEKIIAAIRAEDTKTALVLLEQKERAFYQPVHDALVRFMADVFGWAFREFGATGLAHFHLATAERLRGGFEQWERMTPELFARTTAFLLKQHMSRFRVHETAETYIFEQSFCGSGGQLRLSGAYEGANALPTVTGPAPVTFGKPALPVYCTHCAIWNVVAPQRWFGHAQWVFDAPSRPDGSCVFHIAKSWGPGRDAGCS